MITSLLMLVQNQLFLHHSMGVDPTARNNEGRSAVSYAYKDKTLLELLYQHGGNKQELEKQGPPAPEPVCPHPIFYQTFAS